MVTINELDKIIKDVLKNMPAEINEFFNDIKISFNPYHNDYFHHNTFGSVDDICKIKLH